MTDKEQIMIDGVDVSKCEHWNICKQCELSQLPQSNYELLCKDNPHCYFKQLARKTQECEELKKKIETYKCSTNCHKYIEADRYRKALAPFQDEYFKGLDTTAIAELAKKSIRLTTENRKLETALDEIEEMLQVIVKSNKVYPLQSNLYKILNIISKAKGEENAR